VLLRCLVDVFCFWRYRISTGGYTFQRGRGPRTLHASTGFDIRNRKGPLSGQANPIPREHSYGANQLRKKITIIVTTVGRREVHGILMQQSKSKKGRERRTSGACMNVILHY
jgi:hypothetical protein